MWPPLGNRQSGQIGRPEDGRRNLADAAADVLADLFAVDDLGLDEPLVFVDQPIGAVERELAPRWDQRAVEQLAPTATLCERPSAGAGVIRLPGAEKRRDPERVQIRAVDLSV